MRVYKYIPSLQSSKQTLITKMRIEEKEIKASYLHQHDEVHTF